MERRAEEESMGREEGRMTEVEELEEGRYSVPRLEDVRGLIILRSMREESIERGGRAEREEIPKKTVKEERERGREIEESKRRAATMERRERVEKVESS